MLAVLISILTLQQVHSACIAQSENICTDKASVQQEIVDVHNNFRKAVKASDMLKMSYYDAAASNAQAWIDQCTLGHGDPSTRMIQGYELGENLFYSSKSMTWTEVITVWHSEVENFQWPNITTKADTTIGHYTQVIWNSSYKVGCAMTVCSGGIYYYGCHYYRAGNFKDWQPYTRGKQCDMCKNHCEDNLCTNPCPYVNNFLNCPSVKKQLGCDDQDVAQKCPASCKCSHEIVPIYR